MEQIDAHRGQRVIVDGIRNLNTYEQLETFCTDGVGLLFVQPPLLGFDIPNGDQEQLCQELAAAFWLR
jgi:hypothetical protein